MELNNKPATLLMNDDEIIIRDFSGKLKIWQAGQWQDFIEEKPEVKDGPSQAVLDTGLEGPFLSPIKPVITEISSKKYGINKIVNKVNEVFTLNLTEDKKRKLKNILFSYCHHTRDLLSTLDKLQQPPETGGMAFKLVEAERLMAVVKNILERIENEGGLIIDEEKSGVPSATDLIEGGLGVKVSEPIKEIIPEPPPITINKQKLEEIEPVNSEKTIADEFRGPVFIKPRDLKKTEFPTMVRPVTERAKQITEVKKRPIIFGPVEELSSFSLADFRRLAAVPAERVNKIIEKIETLTEDSLTRKTEGIRAWRHSEVHQLYLQLGAESIKREMPIDQLIGEKLNNNEETLTLAEFEAINELSQRLRF